MTPSFLIVCGIFPPEIGGPATYSYAFSHWLKKKNVAFEVITALKESASRTYPFPVDIQKKTGNGWWHIIIFFRILKKIKNIKAVYVNGLMPESITAAWIRRKKIIVRIAGDQIWERSLRKGWTSVDFIDFQKGKAGIKISLLKKFRRFILSKAEKIIVPSFFLARIVAGWGLDEEKIRVIYNPHSPVEPEQYELSPAVRDQFVIATGGRLVSWKGIDAVVRAVKDIENSHLFITGEGPESEKLRKLVQYLNMNARVTFPGKLSRARLFSLLSQSDCFILNSRYEGLPHIVLEAMAAGIPVMVSDCGGNPEIVEHKKNGFIFRVDNTDDLKRSILEIKGDPALRVELAKNGRDTLETKFNHEEIYQSTLKELLC